MNDWIERISIRDLPYLLLCWLERCWQTQSISTNNNNNTHNNNNNDDNKNTNKTTQEEGNRAAAIKARFKMAAFRLAPAFNLSIGPFAYYNI